jgi:hypothetical protein
MAASATTYIVDLNGGGHFKSIQTAITNSSNGDTVKVWPGTYMEQVTLNKNIVLMGSGYENTIITGSFSPTINISSGKILWFMISSLTSNGIIISGGNVTNCVIKGCAGAGIYGGKNGGTGIVSNCVIVNNAGQGIISNDGNGCYINITGCISYGNTNEGYYGYCGYVCSKITLSYSIGSNYRTNGNQGCVDTNPLFTSSSNYHISEGSPGWNSGNPSLTDPDGSVSDMGYFGGPDCPIYPVVTEMIVQPDGGNIKITAKGRANY